MADRHHSPPPARSRVRPRRRRHLPGWLPSNGVHVILAALVLASGPPLAGLLPPLLAQSSLLESVRRDPARAKAICRQLKQMNKQGVSYTSKQATRTIASQEGLNEVDAEVLTTYVVGMHCPDVR